MPNLPDNFSAWPATVTLDGNGNGTIRFQATGKPLAITNLYVSVSTSTRQATCTIYKNQIGPQYAIKNTNSGSTGASASGRIVLMDGDSVYVVWAGGDAGATATATFSGMTLPFEQARLGGLEFVFDDPIAAGDGSLIFPGLQSINYVAGVSGWRVSRDGDAEFNDVTARGDVIVQSPDGSEVRIETGGNGSITFTPPTVVGRDVTDPGNIVSGTGPDYMFLNVNTPTGRLNGIPAAPFELGKGSLGLLSENKNGPHTGFSETGPILQFNGGMEIAQELLLTGGITDQADGNRYSRIQRGTVTVTVAAQSAKITPVSFAGIGFNITVPTVMVNLNNQAGTFARWGARAINVTAGGFDLFTFKGDNADPAQTGSFNVDWVALADNFT